ncbi:MAG: ATP-binding cassette domain-containing protein [Lachnospiraceae bacterium]|nr:ATP-binding cassette domain-containing protein [Lachnospiraceae bacterium]
MIEFKNISKSYNDLVVFDKLNIKFEEGKCYLLTGISGIGKTTLLRLILGLEKADSGEIIFSDEIKNSDEGVGVVFQEDRLLEDFSSIENVMLTKANAKKEDAINELKKLLDESLINKPVKKLSGGQKRRVSIVRALAFSRDFYILDEPFNGLDEGNKDKVISYIKEKQKDKLIIIASHDSKGLCFADEISLDDYPI